MKDSKDTPEVKTRKDYKWNKE